MPIAALMSLLVASPALPDGAEVLKRCRAAYDSVKTLEEDVYGSIGSGGSGPAMTGTAHILFQRPGKLRVSGDSMFHSKYDLLANGPSVWLLNGGSWQTVKDAQMGIATITGVSANAGMAVPAALFHAQFGDVTHPQGTVSVAPANIKGRRAYRLEEKAAFDISIWIDAETYFLVKTVTRVMNRDIVVEFAPPKVNQPIPARAFKRS